MWKNLSAIFSTKIDIGCVCCLKPFDLIVTQNTSSANTATLQQLWWWMVGHYFVTSTGYFDISEKWCNDRMWEQATSNWTVLVFTTSQLHMLKCVISGFGSKLGPAENILFSIGAPVWLRVSRPSRAPLLPTIPGPKLKNLILKKG